jgi:hypothetical protein
MSDHAHEDDLLEMLRRVWKVRQRASDREDARIAQNEQYLRCTLGSHSYQPETSRCRYCGAMHPAATMP